MLPSSPAHPRAPRKGRPSTTKPAPMPVPAITTAAVLPAGRSCSSSREAASTSFSSRGRSDMGASTAPALPGRIPKIKAARGAGLTPAQRAGGSGVRRSTPRLKKGGSSMISDPRTGKMYLGPALAALAAFVATAAWVGPAAAVDGRLRIITFGAHPDYCDLDPADVPAKWSALGQNEKCV